MRKYLTRTVVTLSFVSLLADIGSEMLYPVMPFYLSSIGFTAMTIGVLEGVAQLIIGFSTGYFGSLSDRMGKRMLFVRTGYLLSAISKTMMAIFIHPWWVFLSRLTDRLGKGVRTGSRDAILSAESHDDHKGKVFGFHRAMDTFGAAVGPVIALVYLIYNPGDYRTLFFIAFGPGLLSYAITFLIRDKKLSIIKSESSAYNFFGFLSYWKRATREYRKIFIGLCGFALFNSSDAFLFLAAKAAGMDDNHIIGAYIFYNIVYAAMAFPAGSMADKFGMKKTFCTGVLLFAIVYAGISMAAAPVWLYIWFFVYGLFSAFTEGVANAWISRHCNRDERGTAIGLYKSINSIGLLVASTLAGFLWMNFSPFTALIYSAIGAVAVIIYFLIAVRKMA